LKENKPLTSNEKIIAKFGLFWFIIVMPYLMILQNKERKFHEEKGIIEVKGVCIDNSRVSHGRFIKYRFQFNDTTYHGVEKIIAAGSDKWNGQIKSGDSIIIQVSLIDPEYNFLDAGNSE